MHPRKYKLIALFAALICDTSTARGVSPYLPLNLDPSLSQSIERVFLLADQPVMTRPIPLAKVLDALPKACEIDEPTCQQVRSFLSTYMRDYGISEAYMEISASSGDSNLTLPNQQGARADDSLHAKIESFYQTSDHLICNLGATLVKNKIIPNSTYISAGWDIAQLDIGYRDLWLSSFSGHSALLSTEAETMPSISLSNYAPISPINLKYQISLSRMSKSHKIRYLDRHTTGYPNLASLHLQAQPIPGYAISINRIMQYGGGERGSNGIKGFLNAFLDPSHHDNFVSPDYSSTQEFGNQAASIEAQLILPTRFPASFYAEYAGEDTSHGSNWKLGNVSSSIGLKISKWMHLLNLKAEVSEWQNGWYVHHIYQDGLTNNGNVIGSWFGDQRTMGDGIGGSSWLIQAGWQTKNGYIQTQYRTLSNQSYSKQNYERSHEVEFNYTYPWLNHSLTNAITLGSDVFGANYMRLSTSFRFEKPIIYSETNEREDNKLTSIFFDIGTAESSSKIIDGISNSPITNRTKYAPHAGIGIRRQVSNRNDAGMRLEFDRINDFQLLSLRLLDWRYRPYKDVGFSTFIGGARYDWQLPAYGYFGGVGIQWRNILPNTDINFDFKTYNKIARDKLLSTDPDPNPLPDIFIDINSTTAYLSYHF